MAKSPSQSIARSAVAALVAVTVVAGCSGGTGASTEVIGVADDDFLRLRAGPGLGYDVILGLPNGTTVGRQGCVTEGGQLWCRIALADAPGIAGYVSADYLSAP